MDVVNFLWATKLALHLYMFLVTIAATVVHMSSWSIFLVHIVGSFVRLATLFISTAEIKGQYYPEDMDPFSCVYMAHQFSTCAIWEMKPSKLKTQ